MYKKYRTLLLILAVTVFAGIVFLGSYLLIGRKKPEVIKGKIAIVIDDWGYNLDNVGLVGTIKYPLTAAVLPYLPYSRSIAEKFYKQRIEVILHLPLEPYEKIRLERNTILTSMKDSEIQFTLRKDLANLFYLKGVSNHMGSLASEDRRVMKIVFQELKKRKLYFLDSLVSPKSVCEDLARKMRLRFVKRDVFLDNNDDAGYIRQQLRELKLRAEQLGQAVGVCHDRRNSLLVLKEEMPRIEKEGFKFVFVSELAAVL